MFGPISLSSSVDFRQIITKICFVGVAVVAVCVMGSYSRSESLQAEGSGSPPGDQSGSSLPGSPEEKPEIKVPILMLILGIAVREILDVICRVRCLNNFVLKKRIPQTNPPLSM